MSCGAGLPSTMYSLLDHVAVLKVDVLPFGSDIRPASTPFSLGSIVMRRLFL